MKKLIIITLLLILISFFISSCDSGSSNNSIVGRWQLIEENNIPITEKLTTAPIYKFKEDGRMVISVKTLKGRPLNYTTEEGEEFNKIIISTPEGGSVYGIYSLEDDGKILLLKTNSDNEMYPTNFDTGDGNTLEKFTRI
ncbi:hypothetical protein KAU33_10085 [Candidatus Dependentiae bacterium]|nr:hypothetical protein [Candidatus Dependentiae bacterium]